MTCVPTGRPMKTDPDIQSKFAPIFKLMLAAKSATQFMKPLTIAEQRQERDVLATALPSILAECSGITMHPNDGEFPQPVMLWDFLNGREICINNNKRGGFDLSIRAQDVRWTETQLPLDLLLLKLLALDYTPEEFRVLTG